MDIMENIVVAEIQISEIRDAKRECLLAVTRSLTCTLKPMFYLLVGLIMSSLASSVAGASGSLEITREVLLENGRYPQVKALIQSEDGGYVVAGSDQHIPWATRTDAEGNVLWRHELPMKVWEPGGADAGYESASAMADNNTLLCGYKQEGEQRPRPVLGLLTIIDNAGKMRSHRLLYPQGDTRFPLNYFRQCVPWGDGFAVVGDTSRWIDGNMQRFFWLLALDAKGDVKWEKLIPNIIPGIHAQALVMPSHDLVVMAMNQMVLLDASGTIKAQRTTGEPTDQFVLVRPIVADSVVRIFPSFNGSASTLQAFGEQLEDLGQVRGPGNSTAIKRSYLLPDHSLLLFGYQRERSTPTASIARFSSDFAATQSFLPPPLWVSNQIDDALPTGTPGEFVTVRAIRPIPHWPDEKRQGLLLTFVRVK